MRTPTKKEIAAVHKLDRQAEKLREESNDICRAIGEKYAPFKRGDIIEGGHPRARVRCCPLG